MRIEFTYARDPEYFRRQLTPAANEDTQWPRTIGQVLLFAAVAVPVVLHGRPIALEIGAALLVAGGLLLGYAIRKRHRMVTVAASWLGDRTWLLTDAGFESRTEKTLALYSWAGLQPHRTLPGAYLLTTRLTGTIIDVPRKPLTSEQDAELGAFLARLPLADAPRAAISPLEDTGTRVQFTSRQPAVRLYGARLEAQRRRVVRRRLLGPGALMLFMVAAAAAMFALHNTFLMLSFAGESVIVLAAMIRTWFRNRKPLPTARNGPQQRYTLTDKAILIESGLQVRRTAWEAVTGVAEWPETYLLKHDGAAPIVIPRDTLTPEQDKQIPSLLRAEGLISEA